MDAAAERTLQEIGDDLDAVLDDIRRMAEEIGDPYYKRRLASLASLLDHTRKNLGSVIPRDAPPK